MLAVAHKSHEIQDFVLFMGVIFLQNPMNGKMATQCGGKNDVRRSRDT
jgi:hypothetical protein